VVLSAVLGREGSSVRVKILYLHGWNSVVGGVKPTLAAPEPLEAILQAVEGR